jgi:hypothetical protein
VASAQPPVGRPPALAVGVGEERQHPRPPRRPGSRQAVPPDRPARSRRRQRRVGGSSPSVVAPDRWACERRPTGVPKGPRMPPARLTRHAQSRGDRQGEVLGVARPLGARSSRGPAPRRRRASSGRATAARRRRARASWICQRGGARRGTTCPGRGGRRPPRHTAGREPGRRGRWPARASRGRRRRWTTAGRSCPPMATKVGSPPIVRRTSPPRGGRRRPAPSASTAAHWLGDCRAG